MDQPALRTATTLRWKWKPDTAQFVRPTPQTLPQSIEDRSDLLTAVRQQLGLQVESAPIRWTTLAVHLCRHETNSSCRCHLAGASGAIGPIDIAPR